MRTKRLSRALARTLILGVAVGGALGGCGPRAAIPTRPDPLLVGALPGELPADHPLARLSTALAPVLYLQADESFQLSRSVAVAHPDSQVIAYHLLWRDDVHGAWIPRTVPTDQEIVWVGYDATGAPVRLWTYWHGTVLTTPWPRRQVAVDVQWGKHGSLPRNTVLGDLPVLQSLGMFYAFAWALPDMWLSRLSREGPLCFCGRYGRYLEFTRPEPLAPHLDAVVLAADPGPVLAAVFGTRYSEKPAWPWLAARR